jgi:6-phosphogluconolactonase (cycloisomerase 2 family)
MSRFLPRSTARALSSRCAGAALRLVVASILALCAQGCGDTPANSVAPLTPLTLVYAFEPGLVYAYQIDANGHVSGVGGSRFRVADRQWNRVVADPGGRFLFATVEQPGEIWVYALDAATGMPSLLSGSPFTPRAPHALHAAVIAPLTPNLYLAGEPGPNLRGDVTAFHIDPVQGTLSEIEASPFRAGFAPYRIWVDPEGRYLYVANNGATNRKQSLAVYSMDPASGALTAVPGSPYETITFAGYLQFHPSGQFLYATADRFFLSYRIGADGSLSPLPLPTEPAAVAAGAYIRALSVTADGRFLHAVEDSGWVITYGIDANSGVLSFVSETRGSDGFGASAFHWSEPLAVFLGSGTVALNVQRVDANRGSLVDAGAPVALADGLKPHAAGGALFFDASGGIVCVVADDSRPASGPGVRLLTYRLATSGGLDGPVEEYPVGEGLDPSIVVVRRGRPTWAGAVDASAP